MNKTLVVGGKGYIGRHLQKRLPHFLYCSREEFNLKSKNEIQNYLKNIEIEKCIILSAVTKAEKKIDFSKEPFETNLKGLNNLLSLLDKNIKVIYFSSMTVYDINNNSPVSENDSLSALHNYGLSKIYAEYLIKYYDFKSLIIRIPGVYGGDRKDGIIYNTIQKINNGIDIEIDTTNLGYWETIHIDDMLDLFCQLLNKYTFNKKIEIVNISYGEEVDFISTVKFIRSQLNSNINIKINKEYETLYLSNKKLKKYVNDSNGYYDRLKSYILEQT